HPVPAVGRPAGAAVRRRKLQTFVIGLVVLMSSATIVVALALLDASSAPFDRAFSAHRGPHAIAIYDAAVATGEQLAAQKPGVSASAGPFGQLSLDLERNGPGPEGAVTV